MHKRTCTCMKSYMMAVSRSDNYSYHFESCVRGYHVYQLLQMKGWFWTKDRGDQEDAEY